LFISVFLVVKSDKKFRLLFGLVALTLAVWALGCAFFSGFPADEYDQALFWFIFGYSGVVFIPVFFAHFVFSFLNENKKWIVYTSYILGGLFLCANWLSRSRYFVGDLYFVFDRFYWMNWMESRNPLWIIFYVSFYWVLLGYSFYLLLKHYVSSNKLRKNQLKYLIIGSVLGWIGGELQFLPSFGIYHYPLMILAGVLTSVYPFIITYGIIRYRLMDLKLAITRTSIFLFVYSLVLGVPFALGFVLRGTFIDLFGHFWWMAPLVLSTVLATGGPFLYMYLKENTENKLYKTQRQYQNTLRKASLGMGRIKDLKRLLNLIVHVVTRTVRIEHCSIYTHHEASEQFVLKAQKGRTVAEHTDSVFAKDSPLIQYLDKVKEPILYDEARQQAAESGDETFAHLASSMKNLNAALILPSFVEQRLIAFLVLGAKKNGELYNHEDLVVFSILANQSGLAIENAQFYEDMKKTHEQLFKAEKMATIGTMADGLSHQMNNRLHAMGFIAGDAIDTIKLKREQNKPKDDAKFYDDLMYSLKRIEDNVKRSGEIAEGLLRYTRKGEEGFSPVDLNVLLDAVLEMIQFKINMRNLDFVNDLNSRLPLIRGNFTQLQEAFFNMIDNAYDAMMQRRDELKEAGYRPRLEVSAEKKGKNVQITIQDNGIGVKEENLRKLFTPFFTTKLSSKKGTGLGMYVIRQIIEENHNGRVQFTSVYKQGSRTNILLPVAEAKKKKTATKKAAHGPKGVKTFFKE
jgi:signal transduction histidine kinase